MQYNFEEVETGNIEVLILSKTGANHALQDRLPARRGPPKRDPGRDGPIARRSAAEPPRRITQAGRDRLLRWICEI